MMTRFSTPGAPSLDCHPVLVETRSITSCKCNTSLAQLQSPNSLDHSLQVHFQTRLSTAHKCIYTLAWSLPPSASPNSLGHGLQVHLQTNSIATFKCISNLARLRLPSLHNHTASKFISKLARSLPWSVSLSSLDSQFQADLELLSSTACSQSRYTVYRWVAILIHRYIYENTNWIHEF